VSGEKLEVPRIVFTEILFELMDRNEIDVESIFSREIGIACTTVNQWTCLKSVVQDHGHIWRLCKYFKVSYEYLIFGIGMGAGELDDICERQKSRIEELERKLNFETAMRIAENQMELFNENN
jgi:hypothetical protein